MKHDNVLLAKTSEMEQKTCLTAGRNRFLLGIITVTFSKKYNLFVLHYLISVYFCTYIIPNFWDHLVEWFIVYLMPPYIWVMNIFQKGRMTWVIQFQWVGVCAHSINTIPDDFEFYVQGIMIPSHH